MDEVSVKIIREMIGQNIVSVENVGNLELIFTADNGHKFTFYHDQDCCESVYIEDISGDLDDLVGELLQAEEVSNLEDFDESAGRTNEDYGSHTWTFYKFATVKGSVTVRWYGSSNGYYSESVDFKIT
ncbi:MAG: hypothetical protein RL621_1854 [Bacteroidota bacterium]|jgi:hypothetical protein